MSFDLMIEAIFRIFFFFEKFENTLIFKTNQKARRSFPKFPAINFFQKIPTKHEIN